METLQVAVRDSPYPIHIGENLLERLDLVLPHLAQQRVAIVTNDIVAPLYLNRLMQALKKGGVESCDIIVPDGEIHKNGETLNRIYDGLLAHRCERKTTLVALGGGVIGDLTGFAAATYLRGVPFIQIPTTLLAQVDSAVGGKTGINHPLGKNMIGAFYQPKAVLSDISTLRTLPQRELSAGLAEVIKYGLIRDLPFFEWLEANMEKLMARDPEALAHAIIRSCKNKAEVVAKDEKENGIRAILNLGHTFGHAIETGTGYGTWLHGEAVAMGTVLAARFSSLAGTLHGSSVDRIIDLYRLAGLPSSAPILGAEVYVDLMQADKKVDKGQIHLVLLTEIGHATVRAINEDELLSTLRSA